MFSGLLVIFEEILHVFNLVLAVCCGFIFTREEVIVVLRTFRARLSTV